MQKEVTMKKKAICVGINDYPYDNKFSTSSENKKTDEDSSGFAFSCGADGM